MFRQNECRDYAHVHGGGSERNASEDQSDALVLDLEHGEGLRENVSF